MSLKNNFNVSVQRKHLFSCSDFQGKKSIGENFFMEDYIRKRSGKKDICEEVNALILTEANKKTDWLFLL